MASPSPTSSRALYNQVQPDHSLSRNTPYDSEWQLYETKSKIFNPCGFCCFAFINLRLCCIIIAGYVFIAGAIGMIDHSIFIPPDCGMPYTTYIEDACKKYAEQQTTMRKYRSVYLAFYLLSILLYWTIGMLLLAATFGRNALAALFATICFNVSSLFYVIQYSCLIIFFHNWPEMPLSFFQWTDEQLASEAFVMKVVYFFLVVFTVLINAYFSVCSIQLGKQIRAQVDTLKVRSKNVEVKPTPTASVQPTAYSTTRINQKSKNPLLPPPEDKK